MIVQSARAALAQLFTPQFRGVFLKSLGITLFLLLALWFGLKSLFDWLALPLLEGTLSSHPALAGWIGLISGIGAGLALAFGLVFLIGPVTAMVAGLFLDDIAERVEAADFPSDPPGRAMPPLRSLVLAIKFFGIVVLGNMVALALLLVPLVNVAAFVLVNGYLLGREFFEFAAMRFRPEQDAKSLRRRHSGTIFLAGLVIAAFMAVPLLNLLTPLFAAAMMVHLHKRLSRVTV